VGDAHPLLAPHNVCGPVGTMANVHFAVATPNYKVLEHFNDFADPGPGSGRYAPRVAVEDGCFALPDRPGLGVRLNHEMCAAHSPRAGASSCSKVGAKRTHDIALNSQLPTLTSLRVDT
jgi:galactonate dehydratase